MEYHLSSPEYFLDRMESWEASELLSLLPFSYRPEWEQVRHLSHASLQPHYKKKIKPSELLQFAWDDDDKGKEEVTVSKEEKERLNEKSKQIAKILYGERS